MRSTITSVVDYKSPGLTRSAATRRRSTNFASRQRGRSFSSTSFSFFFHLPFVRASRVIEREQSRFESNYDPDNSVDEEEIVTHRKPSGQLPPPSSPSGSLLSAVPKRNTLRCTMHRRAQGRTRAKGGGGWAREARRRKGERRPGGGGGREYPPRRPRGRDARCFRKTYRAKYPAIPRTNRVMASGPLITLLAA